jgi:hypothetical protein
MCLHNSEHTFAVARDEGFSWAAVLPHLDRGDARLPRLDYLVCAYTNRGSRHEHLFAVAISGGSCTSAISSSTRTGRRGRGDEVEVKESHQTARPRTPESIRRVNPHAYQTRS